MRDCVVFIMTHGRADRVYTFDSLRKHGYTGPIYLVIDTDDEQGEEYIKRYGRDRVLIFDKKEEEALMDTGDIEGSMKCVVFARNVCFRFAKQLGYEYFVEADDDYTGFSYRFEEGDKLRGFPQNHLDDVFEAMFQFLDDSNALAVAPAQGGDYIGGVKGGIWKDKIKRKCMNLFFCKTKRPINFVGRINEDVTTYAYRGQQGELFFTVCDWHLSQKTTQAQAGGMTETYLDRGTYLKSFYSVMWMPSAVKICMMGGTGAIGSRIHHNVEWNNCVPKILNQKWKKVK